MLMRIPMLLALALFIVSVLTSSTLADDNKAEAVLQQAIAAVGGEGRLATLKAPMMWMQRGTFYGMGDATPFVAQFAAKWPNWHRTEVENAFTITVNGKKAWVSGNAGTRKLVNDELQERLTQVRMAWAERLFPLTDATYELSTIEGIEVDGRPTVGIKASHADGRDVKFYFDNETYLIAKIETMVVSRQHGSEPVLREAFYAEHKSFSGVIMPSKFKVNYHGKLFFEGETIDYKMRATLNPAHFEEPG